MINPSSTFEIDSITLIKNANGWRCNWTAHEKLPYFDGHFPEHPILPAIAIIDLNLELIKKITSNPNLLVAHIATAKFLTPIFPNEIVSIHLNKLNDLNWEIIWNRLEKKVVSIKLTLKS